MRLLLALTTALLLSATGSRSACAQSQGWDYVVRFDATLARAEVRCCFREFLPRRLVSRSPASLSAFTFPAEPGGPRLVLRDEDNSLLPVDMDARRSCVRWEVDVARAARRGRMGPFRRVGRDLMIEPGALMLFPGMWPLAAHVTVRFELPEGYRVLAPWPRTAEGAYVLDVGSTRLLGRFAIGRFDTHVAQVAGSTVEIGVLDAPHAASAEGIRTWVHEAMRAVATIDGRFPTPRLAVIVEPVPGRDPPSPFGTSMRAGGGHVHLLLSNAAKDPALPGEWVAVHEMMHLALPWTFDEEAWLQEGFTTYYQEVLRARAGMISEREAWQNIEAGFGRGRRRGGVRTLALESRDMHREHAYHRVYWAGAAIALLIDVRLRSGSNGRYALDDFVNWWRAHRGGQVNANRGLDLLRAAEEALQVSPCSRIAVRWLESTDFPDVGPVYEALGIRARAGRVELDDTAPQAALRRAIMTSRVR
ncbi:MAG: hypothetical protein O2894_09470 [Planctomycetota bacterium]|nr:hypothetical protein [Planctomycetota bacterium]